MTSVLETFLILFDSNAKQVKQGSEEAEAAVTGLNTKILSTEEISTALGSSFMNMAKQAVGMFAGIFAIQKAIGSVIENAEYAKHINETAESLGISTQRLGEWADAVKHIGGSAEGAISSFQALAGSIAQIDATGHSRVKPFFDELGISMQDASGHIKPINDLLLELADHFEHMSKQESFGFGRKMQLDEGMIRLLQQGRSGVEGLLGSMKDLGDITPEQAELIKKWDEALYDAEHQARTFGLEITTSVLPALTDLVKWFSENGDVISTLLGTITTAVVLLTAKIVILKGVALGGAIITELGEIIAFFQLLIGASTAAEAAVLLAMAPFLIWVALIGGISYALYELWENWNKIGDWMGAKADWVSDKFHGIKDFISGIFGGGESGFNIKKFVDVDHHFENAQRMLSSVQNSPLAAQNSQSIMNSARNFNSVNHMSIDNITIQTNATNADDVAKHIIPAIKDEFNRQFRQTVNSTDNGLHA